MLNVVEAEPASFVPRRTPSEEALRTLVPETNFQPPGLVKFSASMKTVAAPAAARFAKRMSRARRRDFMSPEDPPTDAVLVKPAAVAVATGLATHSLRWVTPPR